MEWKELKIEQQNALIALANERILADKIIAIEKKYEAFITPIYDQINANRAEFLKDVDVLEIAKRTEISIVRGL